MVFLPCNVSGVRIYNVQMTIVRARNLVAKDRHMLTRQRTTSDPFVEVFLGIDQRIGKTITVKKSLNPEWNSTFTFDIDATKSSDESVAGVMFLKLYDQDVLTDHDLIGTLVVPIPAAESGIVETKWYPVENAFCPNATGDVEIKFQLTPVVGVAGCFPGGGCLASITPSPQTVARWVVMGKNSIMPNKTEKPNTNNSFQEDNKPNRRDYIVALIQAVYVNEDKRNSPPKKSSKESKLNLFKTPVEGKMEQDTNQLEDWLMKVNRIRGGNEKYLSFLLKSGNAR
mmetsp:Transcript_22718/g.34359  ORF Transcript_22718/g.34359 Transcript_22718/m.34359 type:complete len:284 (+) Transcript_22718:79-930(+)|eukprot:CAMPEP_0178917136 /NCGR_PEP_ID=MMETSP0786-20121207/13073_1 /TAXON_ID=186022 /ORGANISM="Thalassionema frauenfeldii, Strain CCMP 1798" /LENGTH=283 /DNA_ID=CAMNT_0020590641 /DNA_START=26 /DNA_END=877 /DNA_ORIENTATION=-